MNLVIPKSDDTVELPIPEQYISKIKDGKLVTEIVAHTGA